MNTVVILNNIRSMENVGSIFRTSDAAGVSKIYLVGITPSPTDRFGRENSKLAKSSLGAEKFVEWQKVESLKDLTERLKKEGFKVVAVEQDKKSLDYKFLKTKILPARLCHSGGESGIKNLALVFGNEVNGISKEDLDLCDLIIEIPMKGKKESLNVSVSAGIILFSLLQ